MPKTNSMTLRERQVLLLVANGYSDKHISIVTGLEATTVARILRSLRDRLVARNRSHLVAMAMRKGWIT